MRKIHAMLLAACGMLASTAVHAQNGANAPTLPAYNTQAQPLTESSALQMMGKGDDWAGTNAFKKIVAKNDSPANRFNLATGYQRTGRLDQARAIYTDLLVDGRLTMMSAIPIGGLGARTFNASDEAASRLVYIQWLQSGGMKSASLSGAVSADQLGVPVAAVEGGPRGEVTDAQAAILDRQDVKSQGGAP